MRKPRPPVTKPRCCLSQSAASQTHNAQAPATITAVSAQLHQESSTVGARKRSGTRNSNHHSRRYASSRRAAGRDKLWPTMNDMQCRNESLSWCEPELGVHSPVQIDIAYTYARTKDQTFNYFSSYTNTQNPFGTTSGTLTGSSTGKVSTQGVTAPIRAYASFFLHSQPSEADAWSDKFGRPRNASTMRITMTV
jgi:hypothetical protein